MPSASRSSNRARRGAVALAGLALALACAAARAAGPALRSEGAAGYACGGVGADERQAMQALEAQANVKLLFVTEKRGGWIADVAFTVTDAKGATVLRATSDGPLCLLRLPAGHYKVQATFEGVARSAAVAAAAAPGGPRQAVLAFPGEKWDGIRASEEEKRSGRGL